MPSTATPALQHVRVAQLPPRTGVPGRVGPRLAPPRPSRPPARQTFPTPTVRSAYEIIGAQYIEPIDARRLTLAGVRGLSRLEPAVGAELVGDILRITWAGAPLADVALADTSVDTQLVAARRVIELVSPRSRLLAERTPGELTQLYVFGMKGQLDIYTRYLTPQELAATYARLGVSTAPASSAPTAAPAAAPVTVRLVERSGLPADTAIIRLSAFADDTDAEIARLLTPLVARGVTKIVIDLRGVGGGMVDAAARAADLFLADGPILDLRARDAQYTKHAEARPNSPLESLQVVLVVDGATASAAEHFAATLADVGRAPMAGGSTHAKGRAQAIIALPSGEGLSLSIGELVGPTGAAIHGVGLMPAVCVAAAGTSTLAELVGARRGEVTHGRSVFTNACAAAPALDDRGVDEALRLLADASAFAQAIERQRALAGTPGSQ